MSKKKVETKPDALDNYWFMELMQAFRDAPKINVDKHDVVQRFYEIKDYIRENVKDIRRKE